SDGLGRSREASIAGGPTFRLPCVTAYRRAVCASRNVFMKIVTRLLVVLVAALVVLPGGAPDAAAAPGDRLPTTSAAVLENTPRGVGGGWENEILLGVFPPRSIASLTVHVRVAGPYGEDSPSCRFFGPG